MLFTGPVLITLMAHRRRRRCRCHCHCHCCRAKRCQSAQPRTCSFSIRRAPLRCRRHTPYWLLLYDGHRLAYWPVTACDRPAVVVRMAPGTRVGLNYTVGGDCGRSVRCNASIEPMIWTSNCRSFRQHLSREHASVFHHCPTVPPPLKP